MAKEVLQHSKLENEKPGDKPRELRDAKQTGLVFRIQPRTKNGGGGTKSWYFEYRHGTGTGKRRRNRVLLGRFPAMTPTDARKAAAKKAGELAKGVDPAEENRIAKKSISLEKFIELYLAWHAVNRRQTPATKSRLTAGFQRLMARKVETLALADFTANESWRKTHTIPGAQGPASVATLNVDGRAMHAAFAWGVRNGILTANPMAGWRTTRVDTSRGFRALSNEEEVRLLAALDNGPADFFKPMLLVSLDTGIRVGEARAIEWRDVDFGAETLTVRGVISKNHQTRVIPLTPRARAALADWRAQSTGEGRVFTVLRTSAYTRWRKVCKACGIEKMRWHDLRHTFGSRLALAGVPLTVLMALMGHQNLAVSQRYLHSTANDAAAAIAALAARNGGVA